VAVQEIDREKPRPTWRPDSSVVWHARVCGLTSCGAIALRFIDALRSAPYAVNERGKGRGGEGSAARSAKHGKNGGMLRDSALQVIRRTDVQMIRLTRFL
jgi:hypothetical protein